MKPLYRVFSAIKLMLTLKCEQSTHIVSESLDRDLSFVERWAVRLHYISCWSCRRFSKQIRQMRDLVRQHPERPTETAGLSPDATRRIEEAIRKES